MNGRASIWRAVPRDVAGITGLSSALFREDAGRRDPFTNQGWPKEEGEGYFTDLVTRERSLCLLAEAYGEAVGYLAGYVGEPSTLRPVVVAELESMYIQDGYRGLGLGERMMRGFLEWAEAEGAERAAVTAYAANEGAIRFYQRCGFQPWSTTLEKSIG